MPASVYEYVNIRRGERFDRKNIRPGNIPVVGGGYRPAGWHDTHNHPGECVTISATGSAGAVNWWDSPVFITDKALLVEPKQPELLLPKYLYYLLENVQQQLCAAAMGTGVKHFHPNGLKRIPVTLPPTSWQKRAVNILDIMSERNRNLDSAHPYSMRHARIRDRLITNLPPLMKEIGGTDE